MRILLMPRMMMASMGRAQHAMAEQVSITEAARLLGTSRPTLSKLLSDHDFPRVRSGGKTLVSVREVQAFYHAVKNPEEALGLPRPTLPTEHLSQLQARCDQLQARCDLLSGQLESLQSHLHRGDRATPAPVSWRQVLVRLFSPWG